MGTKSLTISGATLDYAIRQGLQKIGLPQERTVIRVLQKESRSFFRSKEAIIEILYDEEESKNQIKEKNVEEIIEQIRFRWIDGKAEIKLPPIFFQTDFLQSFDEKEEFILQFLKEHEVTDVKEDLIKELVRDQGGQFNFTTVKELPCYDLNDKGGKIHISTDEELMQCRAIIFHGEKGVTEEQVLSVLKSVPVVEGIQRKILSRILQAQYTGFFTLAKGTHPIPDQAGNVEKFFQEDERKIFAQMMEALTIDTRSIKDINIADRNQLLMRVGEIIPGNPGRMLDGTPIAHHTLTESELSVKLGERVYRSDDGKEIYAKENGHIIWKPEENFIDVEPVYFVDGNVDFSEGNIQGFVGKVIVNGNVKPKFKVVAEGDIEIRGTVEDAIVRSTSGSIVVLGSVIQPKEGIVEAKESVHVNIATNAHLKGKKVIVEKETMNSIVDADEEFESVGSPGAIIGGEIYARILVRANIIGSESGVQTEIHVGDVRYLRQKLMNLTQNTAADKNHLQELKEIAKILQYKRSANDLHGEQVEQLQKCKEEIPSLEEKVHNAAKEEKAIQKQIKGCRPARLEVLNVMYPQVEIYLLEVIHTVQSPEKFTGFRCKNGYLQYYSL